MQKILFYGSVMLLMLLNTSLFAQSAEQCLTETNGCSPANAVFQGCFPGWIATHGTPSAAVGDGFDLFLYPPEEACIDESDYWGEGAAVNIDITKCADLNFTIQQTSNSNEFDLYWVDIIALRAQEQMTNTLATTFLPTCQSPGGYEIPPVPVQQNVLLTVESFDLFGGAVLNVSEEVEIPNGTVQLWIRPYGKVEAADPYDVVGITIKDFCVSECVDPCPPVEDSDGECTRDDAAFILEADAIPGNFNQRLYYPVNYELYDDLGGSHSWKIYSSDEPEGPFELLETIQADYFERTLANGPIYTVIHSVDYECGEYCYGDNACGSCTKLGNKGENEFLGPICCDVVLPVCDTQSPGKISCQVNFKNGTEFIWGAVPGASSYEVDFYNNSSPICNGNVTAPNVIVTTNSVPKPSGLGTCYCVRVRSIYPNGCVSGWSTPFCDNGQSKVCLFGPGGGGADNFGNTQREVIRTEISPNPSAGMFNIQVVNPAPENRDVTLRIYDLNGRIVHQAQTRVAELSVSNLRWEPANDVARGVYILRIASGGNIDTRRLILQ